MKYKIYAPFALALISTVASAKTAEECLHKDERFLNAHKPIKNLETFYNLPEH